MTIVFCRTLRTSDPRPTGLQHVIKRSSRVRCRDAWTAAFRYTHTVGFQTSFPVRSFCPPLYIFRSSMTRPAFSPSLCFAHRISANRTSVWLPTRWLTVGRVGLDYFRYLTHWVTLMSFRGYHPYSLVPDFSRHEHGVVSCSISCSILRQKAHNPRNIKRASRAVPVQLLPRWPISSLQKPEEDQRTTTVSEGSSKGESGKPPMRKRAQHRGKPKPEYSASRAYVRFSN